MDTAVVDGSVDDVVSAFRAAVDGLRVADWAALPARVLAQVLAELEVERRRLTGEHLPPIHPRTADALAAGEISAAHVDVITRYLGRIPATVAHETTGGDATVFELAEAFLVQAARH